MFIVLPLPPIMRVFALAALAVAALVVLEATPVAKITLGIVGAFISAVLLKAGSALWGVLRKTISNSRAVIAPASAIVVATVMLLGDQTPASAQADAPACTDGFEIRLYPDDKPVIVLPRSSAVAPELTIDGDPEVVDIEATTTNYTAGSVVVRLVDTEPVSFDVGSVLWAGTFDTEGGELPATTEREPISISRTGFLQTYSISADAHESSLGLVAGKGTFVATFIDAFSDASCSITVDVRVASSPLTTLVGQAALALGVLGCGLVVRGAGPSSRLDEIATMSAAGTVAWARLPKFQKIGTNPDTGNPIWKIELTANVKEREHDVYEVEAKGFTFTDLIDVTPTAAVDVGSKITIPLALSGTTKEEGIVGCTIALKIDGKPYSLATVRLRRGRFTVEPHGGPEIDLREHEWIDLDESEGNERAAQAKEEASP